jgi:hypothetical protein
MKLFGGKKGDDKAPMQGDDEAGYYDSPVETVSLSGGSTNRGGASSSGGGGGGGAAAGSSNKVVVDQHEDEPRPHYGIEQAIQLMRALPVEDRVSNLKRAIADFEKEIETRREEIGRLEADHKETTAVRGRLELAEKAVGQGAVAKTG